MRACSTRILSVLALVSGCIIPAQPPVSGAPAPVVIAAAQSLGCFRDQGAATGTDGRDLPDFALNLPQMTNAVCREECERRGFAYAGTQYATWCFCGNDYGRSGPAGNCDMRCGGASQEICGGAWANSVFATRNAAAVRGPAVSFPRPTTIAPGNSADDTNSRSTNDANLRPDGCPVGYGALLGKPCLPAQEGKGCGPEHPEQLDGWVNLVLCSGGTWIRLEAPPRPAPHHPCAQSMMCIRGTHFDNVACGCVADTAAAPDGGPSAPPH